MGCIAYRWALRKSSRKEICPCCGQRRFVPYVSKIDGVTLAGAEYGKCDRISSCGYHKYPNGKKIDMDELKKNRENQTERKPLRFYPAAVTISYDTPLFVWAASLFGTHNALKAWNAYKVGADGKRTVFWQIDINGEIRGGKSIPYMSNGHRDKTDRYPASWLHKAPAWKNYHEGEELHQCFFGEHLLKDRPDAPVAIVESEKTAIILSQYSKDFVWLACGGAQMLKNPERNQVLKGRRVVLIPDNGQYWNWNATAEANGWEIRDELEKAPIFEGCDILDMVESGALGEDLLKYKKQK